MQIQECPEVLSEARARGERLAKLILDIDGLASRLTTILVRSKLRTVRNLASQASSLSQAIRMALSLERPAAEVLAIATDMKECVVQLRLFSSKARVDKNSMVALGLQVDLIEELCIDLNRWALSQQAELLPPLSSHRPASLTSSTAAITSSE